MTTKIFISEQNIIRQEATTLRHQVLFFLKYILRAEAEVLHYFEQNFLGKYIKDKDQLQILIDQRKEVIQAVEKARAKFGDDIFAVGISSPVKKTKNNWSAESIESE